MLCYVNNIHHKVSFLKKLRTIAWRFTVIKEELLCFIIAFAEATLFSVSWASSSEYFFFVLVNDLYRGDPLEANKRQEICIIQ